MTDNTPASRKAKGRKFQQEIRDLLIKVVGINPEDIESRSMGAQGTDIMLSAAAQVLFPYAIEAKSVEKLNIWEAWKQAEANSTEDLAPILFIKRARQQPLVVLTADEFIDRVADFNDMYERWEKLINGTK